MKNINFKKIIPHLLAIGIFLGINFVYFSPAFTGKSISQHDLTHVKGMAKEATDFRNKTGEQTLWTNSMFGGMPMYHIGIIYEGNLFRNAYKILSLGLPNPVKFVFLYMIGFYILMIILGVNPWLAIGGTVAFSFSSYLFQIIGAGHSSKAHAIAYMAPIFGSMILIFRKKYLVGGSLFALFFTLQLRANHIQITYYLGFIFAFYFILKLYELFKKSELPHFFKSTAIVIGGVALALLINIGNIWNTYQYGKETMRSESELTSKVNLENKTTGLDRDYITHWSYGVGETWNLFVPNFKGGSSSLPIAENKEALKDVAPEYRQVMGQIVQYFGDQPGTSGPYYIGAVVIFLFVLALFFFKGTLKWAVVLSICLAIPLSWGKNFMGLTDFFIDYIPLYNKFRTVPMIQVIVQFLVPFFAFYVLDRLLAKDNEELSLHKKKFYMAAAIPTGILLLFYMSPTSFNTFFGAQEYERLQSQLTSANWPQNQITGLLDNIEIARITIFKADVLRSLIFVLLSVATLWLFVIKKLNRTAVIAAIVGLVLVDMWTVDKRYLNDKNFSPKRKVAEPFKMTAADQQILSDPDPYYRVLNLTVNTFNDASTSYFHKSVGGYHAAKLGRYQELIDFHIGKNNMDVLNMLNTKYFISPGQNGAPMAQKNGSALGNAWFVETYKIVENGDAEIEALNDFDPARTAIIDKRYKDKLGDLTLAPDASASINLDTYAPNKLTYTSNASKDGVVVFSDIYYEDGWNAYIDGNLVPHFRTNYVLRGLKVPAGKHQIEFIFEPKTYAYSTGISLAASIILILLLAGTLYREFKKNGESPTEA